MFFVCPQGIVEKYLKVGGRCGCRIGLRHECKSGDSLPLIRRAVPWVMGNG